MSYAMQPKPYLKNDDVWSSRVRVPRGESDYHLVIHMIGPTRVYFKGFSLATGMYFQEKSLATGMYFQEKSLATGVKLLYFP